MNQLIDPNYNLGENLQPTKLNLGRILVGAMFLITGIYSAFKFNNFTGAVASKNLPFPVLIAIAGVAIKILGGASVVLNYKANYGRWILIAFTIVATVLYHNFVIDPSQFNAAMKNLSVIGGLMLI